MNRTLYTMLTAITVSQVTLPLSQTYVEVINNQYSRVKSTISYANGGVQVEYLFNCTNEEDLNSTDLEK